MTGHRLRPDSRTTRSESMPITLSEKAAAEIKRIMDEQGSPEETFIRVGVQGGGCSGFSYSLNWDTQTNERDRVAEFHGVKVVIEKKFDPYLDGTVIDFYDGLE